ncbi:DUF4252 domain-containing protein [Flavobacteriaceae bacterium XHP0103]|uniref:DUF4252 domain-containing protein n=1 Tax=Marixanthotalea marina TaxID=2844359 RepID=UPI00298A07C6|nr:DUF4252 domain-containing protein [Marixanthotalea marina]MBU3821696.1 DUF4252 domain-containing protein [Marixanthotalea marina]
MQRTIKSVIVAIFAAFFLVGCNDGLTLQRYFVDHQESTNFISQDFPISMLKIDEANLTGQQKEALKSVKRLNFLGYKIDEAHVDAYSAELSKVKAILSKAKYNELADFSYQGAKVSMKYIGDDDKADEVVLFGSSKDMGFGVVRILGDEMTPDKIITLAGLMEKNNVDTSQLGDIINFFK